MIVTALLPMKGHSERVPNKNMRMFAGKPLYHCVAEILEMSEFIDSIVINTDSLIIAEDAQKNFSKVEIHKRPAELCGDMVPMNDIITFDLMHIENESILQTHSTNPLLSLETLNRAISCSEDIIPEKDSLFSVTKYQTRLYWGNGKALNHDPSVLLRTQDLPPIFEENSNLYIFSKKAFTDSGKLRIGLKPYMFEMNKLEAIDIDEEEDFILAEMRYLSLMKKENGKLRVHAKINSQR